MTPTFLPELPQALSPLRRVLSDAWWTWQPEARALVRDIDPEAWFLSRGRVKPFAKAVKPARWQELAADADFVAKLTALAQRLDDYLTSETTWWDTAIGEDAQKIPGGIAYFSAEFGVHEGWPIYSGGLGVLAGDHIKSASDLGLPFVGVGLYYHHGYFQQGISPDGKQTEAYPHQHPVELGFRRAVGAGGQPLEVYVPMADRKIRCVVWEGRVGRARLYLLDAAVPGNRPDDQELSHRLYGGDSTMRIAQEILLGVGGLRAIRGLGFDPSVLHLNEGHCAFVALERLREELERGFSREEAWELVRQECVFTTHTPVAAGHDRFWQQLVAEIAPSLYQRAGMSLAEFMDLGREHPGSDEQLCMTVLAARASRSINGVSAKHGEVSRAMWQQLWPGRAVDEVPIGHVTNGVHARAWLGPEVQRWLDDGLGADWRDRLVDDEPWADVEDLDGAALWAAHRAQKARLLELVARKTGKKLDPDALLLGFARRFAPYKRGDMILSDHERTLRLLTNADRPVNLLYAGKAHPRDESGKAIVARVLAAARDARFEGHVIFLQDYDIGIGRALVQGVDVWINNPRRPREASGTSGQKVSMNGGMNCSTLDGWWLEGYFAEPRAGWAVGSPEADPDLGRGDHADTEALYRILENEVVPTFYDRGPDGLPDAWIARMKAAIATCLPAFNTDRMVADYARNVYLA